MDNPSPGRAMSVQATSIRLAVGKPGIIGRTLRAESGRSVPWPLSTAGSPWDRSDARGRAPAPARVTSDPRRVAGPGERWTDGRGAAREDSPWSCASLDASDGHGDAPRPPGAIARRSPWRPPPPLEHLVAHIRRQLR